MIFILFLFLNLIVLLFFFWFQKKQLHLLEVFLLWLVSSMLFQNFSALFFMNFKHFIIPNVFSLEITHFMNRTILIPVLTLTFLNRYIGIQTFFQKAVLTFMFIFLFVGIEEFVDYVGVLKHIHWKLWWSISFWVVYILLLIVLMRIFRKTLAKEVG